MPAYVEVMTRGGGRAYIEAGAITGAITSPGQNAFTTASEKEPIALILRGGESFQIVDTSVAVLLARCTEIRAEVKAMGLDIKCDFLDPPNAPVE